MLEIAVYSAVTGIWWISSATVLLPFLFLLKVNKTFRNRWFSFYFIRFIKPFFEPKLLPMRKKAFDILNDNLTQRDVSKPLKILEIGIGSGANLQFYPENSHLTALDMNASFETYFRENKKKYPNIMYEKTIVSVAENMEDIKDASMDIVISTYVLCSVTSINDCMREVKRVLKQGGKFLFLEHVGFPKSEWGFTVQSLASPLWTIYNDGCCLTRHIGDDIKKFGFSHVICEKAFPSSLVLFVRPQVYGLATK